jgi:hypothetical protein
MNNRRKRGCLVGVAVFAALVGGVWGARADDPAEGGSQPFSILSEECRLGMTTAELRAVRTKLTEPPRFGARNESPTAKPTPLLIEQVGEGMYGGARVYGIDDGKLVQVAYEQRYRIVGYDQERQRAIRECVARLGAPNERGVREWIGREFSYTTPVLLWRNEESGTITLLSVMPDFAEVRPHHGIVYGVVSSQEKMMPEIRPYDAKVHAWLFKQVDEVLKEQGVESPPSR